MPINAEPKSANTSSMTGDDERKLAEKVAQRVYELWREDMRREQERRGRKIRR